MSASFSRSTKVSEMSSTINESGPGIGETLVEYGQFVVDLAHNAMETIFLDDPAAPNQLDGHVNDDQYRRSRHLIRKISPKAVEGATGAEAIASLAADEEMLVENSLARQLASKKDQPSIIRVIRRRRPEEMTGGSPFETQLPWVNVIPPSTKFLLESVSENHEEKAQIMETFGEFVVFFFGKRVQVFSYSGTLLNAKNHNWKNEFKENYEHFLRGTKAVENQATLMLQYDDTFVEGYMLGCSFQQTAIADKACPFTFNVLVINQSPMDPRNMLAQRFRRSGGTPAEQALFNSLQETLNLTKAGRLEDLQTFLIMREYFAGNYVPAAGTASYAQGDGLVTSETNAKPGQTSGLVDEKPASAPFDAGTTNKINQSGVVGDFPGGSFGSVA